MNWTLIDFFMQSGIFTKQNDLRDNFANKLLNLDDQLVQMEKVGRIYIIQDKFPF